MMETRKAGDMQGFEIIERVRDARAQLLAVERLPCGEEEEGLGMSFLLVFDVGRLLVVPDGEALCIRHIEQAEDVPGGMRSSLEEEPWWRVLGCSVSGAWSEPNGKRLRLELASGDAAPRSIALSLESGAVRSALTTSDD